MGRFAPGLALAAAFLSGCATSPQAVERPGTAAVALRGYYATIPDSALPVAPPGVALDPATTLTRIAFGSCLHQDRHQTVWPVIAATDPQLFMLIGDNVYGDTGTQGQADIPTLTRAYRRLSERPEFRDFRARVPMLTTWDDHDYGWNDAGGNFAFKEWGERVYERYWGAPDVVRSRPGIHESRIIGPEGRRVQIILLDTRFFRSDLRSLPYQDPRPPLGVYVANDDPGATLLGEDQWRWLAAELDKPADLRLIVSSIQVVTDAHGFEKWGNFPADRDRLYRMLADKRIGNAVLLSGDRHQGAIYKATVPGMTKPLWELTSTSLNLAFVRNDGVDREPDPARTDGMFSQENFGLVDIDWTARRVTLKLHDSSGALLASREVPALN